MATIHSTNAISLRVQLQQLGRRIRALRNFLSMQEGTHVDGSKADLELLLNQQGDLQRRLDKLSHSSGQRDHRMTSALWADLEGLKEALEAWIDRQDRQFLSRQ
jgi:hypothetical protein